MWTMAQSKRDPSEGASEASSDETRSRGVDGRSDDDFLEFTDEDYADEDFPDEDWSGPTDEEIGMSKPLAEFLVPSRRTREVTAVVLAVVAVFLLAAPTWELGRYVTGDPAKGKVTSCEEVVLTTVNKSGSLLGRGHVCTFEWRRGGRTVTTEVNGVGFTEGDQVKVRVHGTDAYRFPHVTMGNILGLSALAISVWFFRSSRRVTQS